MQKIRGGNEKIAVSIQSTMIGRDLKDYPALIEDYNETVADFEAVLVKYLKGGIEAKSRPMIRRGGFLGMGGTKIVSNLPSFAVSNEPRSNVLTLLPRPVRPRMPSSSTVRSSAGFVRSSTRRSKTLTSSSQSTARGTTRTHPPKSRRSISRSRPRTMVSFR
jgi:hypothetical protein